MTNPKLTVIIPCFNCQETLGEALASVYEQNLSIPFEVIMVDDASTDKTWTLMQELAKKYPNVSLFQHDKNRGGGATRNTAIAKSTGDLIFCLDSDDILPKGTLEKMAKFLLEKKCDGVTIHRSIKFSDEDIQDIDRIETAGNLKEPISFYSLLSENEKFCPLLVNFMYTKRAFEKIGGYPTRHGFDTQGFAWRFLCAGLSAFVCPETEYLHRINFTESYYLREYNNGKANYNWRDIFLEHHCLFNDKTRNFIISFDCRDFTRSLFNELTKLDKIMIPDFKNTLGKNCPPLNIESIPNIYIKRKSLKGLYFRIKYRLKKAFLGLT